MPYLNEFRESSLRQLKIFRYILEFLAVLVALLFTGFHIYFHINELPYLILYSVLGGLSLLYFLYFLFLSNQFDKKDNKQIKRIVRYLKIATRGVIIVFSIIELANGNLTALKIFITVITLIVFINRILYELFLILLSHFYSRLKDEIKSDLDGTFSTINKVREKTKNKYSNYNEEKTKDDDDNIIDV